MSPIKGIMYKVERAEVHLNALSEAVEAWREKHADSLIPPDDLEGREYVVEIRPPDADIRLALIAGDFVCCLRSALDHLAWQLAATVNPDPPKRICFPIYGENTLDTQYAFAKATHDIPEEAIVTIRSLQPYHGGDAYKSKYLWILHALWNIDKHRHIPLHAFVSEWRLDPTSAKPLRIEKFDDYAKLIFTLSDKPNVKFEPMPLPEVLFGDQKEGIRVTVENLRKIHEAIRDQIIPAFAGFFP